MNSSRRKLSDEEIRILALACGFNCKLSGKDLEIQQRDIENYISKLSPELQESIYAETIEASREIGKLTKKEREDMILASLDQAPFSSAKMPDIAILNVPYIQAVLTAEENENIGKLIAQGVRVQRDTARVIMMSRKNSERE